MKTEKKNINCVCGYQIDTSDNQSVVICPECNRRYMREAPKLLFLGIKEEIFPPGTIII